MKAINEKQYQALKQNEYHEYKDGTCLELNYHINIKNEVVETFSVSDSLGYKENTKIIGLYIG